MPPGATDIGTGFQIVNNGNLATVTAEVKAGFNNGGWNGSTGVTSSAAANDPKHLTAVGVIQNSVDGTPSARSSTAPLKGNPRSTPMCW